MGSELLDEAESNEAYHSDLSHVSASMLKTLRRSPRIFEASYIKKTMPFKESAAMRLGTAVHCYALEFEEYSKRYVVNPHNDRRTKAYKEWAAEIGDCEVITEADHATIESCTNSLLGIPVIAKLLEAEGQVEQSIRCDDYETGVPCKIRCDKLIVGGTGKPTLIVDIKTVAEWSERKFAYACEDFGYHIQAAHYAVVASQHFDIALPFINVVFAVVETQPPFRARAVRLDDESFRLGMQERYRLLCEYQDRMESGDWSELGEHELTEITLPSIYRKRGEDNGGQ